MANNLVSDISDKPVVLLSGGIDSTVLAYVVTWARPLARAMTFNFGQRNYLQSLCSINFISHDLHLPVDSYNVPSLMEMFSTRDDLPAKNISNDDFHGPTRRSSVMIHISAYLSAAADYTTLAIGYNKDELAGPRSGGTDPRRFFSSIEGLIQASLGKTIKIVTPFSELSKKDIVKLAERLGKERHHEIPLVKTWSCWLDGIVPCESCVGCRERNAVLPKASRRGRKT